jgi:DNA-binding transcriptional regulator YiaG
MSPAQIRALRDELQDTQAEFARRLGLAHKSQVSRLESGERPPDGPTTVLLRLLRLLADRHPKIFQEFQNSG